MATFVSVLPPDVEERLRRFLADGCTGSIELHINAGSIQAWKVVESGRVDGRKVLG